MYSGAGVSRMDELLRSCYNTIETIERALKKSITPNLSKKKRMNDYESELIVCKERLTEIFPELFTVLVNDEELVGNLGRHIIRRFYLLRQKHTFDDLTFRSGLTQIVKPLIASLVEQPEVNKMGQDVQAGRKKMLLEMLRVYFDDDPESLKYDESSGKNHSNDSGLDMQDDEDIIDVESIDDRDADQSQNINVVDIESNGSSPAAVLKPSLYYSRESMHVLTLLFDSIKHLCKTSINSDFVANVYFIMNIFEIVDILKIELTGTLKKIQCDEQNGINFNARKNTKRVLESLIEYRKDLESSILKLSLENSFVLLRSELRSLFVLVSTLIGSMVSANRFCTK